MKILFKGGQWTNAEDELLKAGVMKYGKQNWGRIASLITRKSADQCKQRWTEWIDPAISRSDWSHDEELKLMELAESMPSLWRSIAGQLPGRTAAMCMAHYEYLLDRARTGDTAGGAAAAGAGGKPGPGTVATGAGGGPAGGSLGDMVNSWESMPARADAVDEDGYERDMMDAARGRLANTMGKKDLRKQREKQLAEAKQRAELQKQRELAEAGLGGRRSGVSSAAADAGIPLRRAPGAVDEDDVAVAAPSTDTPFQPVNLHDLQSAGGGQRKPKSSGTLPAGIIPPATDSAQTPALAAALDFRFDFGDGQASVAAARNATALVVPKSLQLKQQAAAARRSSALQQPKRTQPQPADGPSKISTVEASATAADLGLALPTLSAGPKRAAGGVSTARSNFATLLGSRFSQSVSVPSITFASRGGNHHAAEALIDEELRAITPSLATAGGPVTAAVSLIESLQGVFSSRGKLAGLLSPDDSRSAACALIDAEAEMAAQDHTLKLPPLSAAFEAATAPPATVEGRREALRQLRALYQRVSREVEATPGNTLVATDSNPLWTSTSATADADDDVKDLLQESPAADVPLRLTVAVARRGFERADKLRAQAEVDSVVYAAAKDDESFAAAGRLRGAEADLAAVAQTTNRLKRAAVTQLHASGA
jgi:hypothetical protein